MFLIAIPDPVANENYFLGWKYFQGLVGTDALVPIKIQSDMPVSEQLYIPGYVGIQLQYYQRTALTRRLITGSVTVTNWIEVKWKTDVT